MHRLSQFLRLQPGEIGLVLVLACLLFGNSLAQQVSEITAISNFLSEGGVNQILIVWGFDSLVIFGMTGLQSLIVDRFNRVALIRGVLLTLAAAFIILRLLFVFGAPHWFNYALLYLLSEQQWLFFPLVFWILANDTLSMSQATRLFPLIASADFMGRLTGIGITAAASSLMQTSTTWKPEALLLLNAFIYLLAAAAVSVGMRKARVRKTIQPKETVRETLSEGWNFVRDVPAFRYLAISIAALLICDTVIEFRFLSVTEAAFSDPARYQTFYSFYRLGITLVIIAVQSLVTSRLITSLQLKNTFFIKPISILAGILLMILQPGLAGGIGGMVLLKLSSSTVDEPSRKTFQSLVPEERRGRVSIFMDSYLYCVGVIFGCIVTGIIVFFGVKMWSDSAFYAYLTVAGLAAVVAIIAIVEMRKVYDTSLLNWRLKRRQRASSILDRLEI